MRRKGSAFRVLNPGLNGFRGLGFKSLQLVYSGLGSRD